MAPPEHPRTASTGLPARPTCPPGTCEWCSDTATPAPAKGGNTEDGEDKNGGECGQGEAKGQSHDIDKGGNGNGEEADEGDEGGEGGEGNEGGDEESDEGDEGGESNKGGVKGGV